MRSRSSRVHRLALARALARGVCGADEMAGPDLPELRLDGGAGIAVVRVGAACSEAAGLGRVNQIGRAAWNRREPTLPDLAGVAFELRQGSQQRLGIGMLRGLEEC